MIITTEFDIKDIVYLKTDVEQTPRIITGIKVLGHEALYQLSCGSQFSDHYAFEISAQRDVLTLINNDKETI